MRRETEIGVHRRAAYQDCCRAFVCADGSRLQCRKKQASPCGCVRAHGCSCPGPHSLSCNGAAIFFLSPSLTIDPAVTPNTKCRLRLLKLERVKDYLLMEEEFIQNQERLKPQEEKSQVRALSLLHQRLLGSYTQPAAASQGVTARRRSAPRWTTSAARQWASALSRR